MHAQSPNSDEERGAWLGFREWTVQRFRGGVNACGRWPWQFCLLQSPSGLAWSGSPRLAGRHPQFWIFRAASPPPSHVVKIVGCHRPVLSVSQLLPGGYGSMTSFRSPHTPVAQWGLAAPAIMRSWPLRHQLAIEYLGSIQPRPVQH
jgi:hypothetical protein